MYSVYQHWDPLKVCVVGRSYPPEFYDWIKNVRVRSLFEQIAAETEEDYQAIIKKLQEFGVQILRPNLMDETFINGKYQQPPMTPRDHMVMIGETFYENYSFDFRRFYADVKDTNWPDCANLAELALLPESIRTECYQHDMSMVLRPTAYDHIFAHVRAQGNQIKSHVWHGSTINGSQVSRIGRDLYFGTNHYTDDTQGYQKFIDQEFANNRCHIINTGGHGDGTYCPVCPGLIISLYDVPTYAETFPGWEVVYLPNQSWEAVSPFLKLKKRNHGRWWIPGFENDLDLIETVETWMGHWVGYVEETVFDVNMLIIDPRNVMVFNHNEQVFEALQRHGITAHVVPFRHRYFWDGGIHCVTLDLHREGQQQDYFKDRK
jgi:hypothetical protein